MTCQPHFVPAGRWALLLLVVSTAGGCAGTRLVQHLPPATLDAARTTAGRRPARLQDASLPLVLARGQNVWDTSDGDDRLGTVLVEERTDPPPGGDKPFFDESPAEEALKSPSEKSWVVSPQMEIEDPRHSAPRSLSSVGSRIWDDHLQFYDPETLMLLGAGIGVAGITANTQIDREMSEHYHSSVDSTSGLRDVAISIRTIGDGKYTLPVFGAAWIAGYLLPESDTTSIVARWGGRSLRTAMVGTPPLMLLQSATGGSRPVDGLDGSRWKPFSDDNGVSGHAFMGAIPFLSAASLTDEPLLKATFIAASLAPAWTRFHDDAHFLSQAALGWWLAYLASAAVTDSDRETRLLSVQPMLAPNTWGLQFEFRR